MLRRNLQMETPNLQEDAFQHQMKTQQSAVDMVLVQTASVSVTLVMLDQIALMRFNVHKTVTDVEVVQLVYASVSQVSPVPHVKMSSPVQMIVLTMAFAGTDVALVMRVTKVLIVLIPNQEAI